MYEYILLYNVRTILPKMTTAIMTVLMIVPITTIVAIATKLRIQHITHAHITFHSCFIYTLRTRMNLIHNPDLGAGFAEENQKETTRAGL